MANIGSGVISKVRLSQQGSSPAAPASTYWLLYVKSGGLFYKDSANNEYQVGKAADAVSIQGKAVDTTAPTDGQVLVYSVAGAKYVPGAPPDSPDLRAELRAWDDFVGGPILFTDGGHASFAGAFQLGWSGVGGFINQTEYSAAAGHPGSLNLETGSSHSGTVIQCFLPTSYLSDETFDLTASFAFERNALADNFDVRFGLLGDITAAPPDDGVYVEKLAADTALFGVARAATVQTRTASLMAVDDSLFHRYRVRRINGTTVGFTADGGSELTVASHVPTGANLTLGFQLIARDSSDYFATVDWVDIRVTGLTR